MTWLRSFSLIFVLLLSMPAMARQGEPPRSWTYGLGVASDSPIMSLPAIDAAFLLEKENEATPKEGGGPIRFAVPFAVSVSPARDGEWTELADGSSLWRQAVEVPGATDLNLGFSQFHMPRGATLHLWTDSKERYYQGPYTAGDNRAHGQLWTPVLPGERVIIELFLPASATTRPILELTQVGAGFRDFFNKGLLPTPRQGACNIDVVCPEGDDWRDQIRSVAVYQLSGRWTCTGSLVNDVPQSLSPHFLTANHCGISGSNASSMVVYWNFESPTCGALSGGDLSQNQTGATLLASRSDVDMALVLLDEEPPEDFEVYYSGWDRSNTQPGGAVGIHHPSTDEKAISFTSQNLTTTASCIGSSTPGTHWTVPFWDLGTTEPGSSGSGLWHPTNQRLIGFLSGGTASCYDTGGYDCYGKLAVAWDGSGASSRLRDWLDPTQAAPDGVGGTDPSGFQILPDTTVAGLCLPGNVVFDLDILRAGDFSGSVSLAAVDLPAAFSTAFSTNPVTPPASSTLTIGNVTAGVYPFRVIGTAPDSERQVSLTIIAVDGLPGNASITAPSIGAQDVGTSPLIEWSAASQGAQYELEIATDPGFTSIVYAAVTADTHHFVQTSLNPSTDYYLRVRALNDCGIGPWSAAGLFTTALEVCVTPNLSIPDDNPTGVSSTIEVESGSAIDALTVSVDITHTWVGDLIVDLEHVDTGTTRRLFQRPGVSGSSTYGCSGDDLRVLFDDSASQSIQSSCNSDGQAFAVGGSYRPYQLLSGFSGLPLEGTWRLRVSDHAGADIGTLGQWCLIPSLVDLDLTVSVAASPVEGGTVTGGGSYEPGAEVTVSAEPAEGYLFVGWKENGAEVSTSAVYTFIAEGSRNLVAVFEQLELVTTADSSVADVGEEVMVTVEVVTSDGSPHSLSTRICVQSSHSGGGEVELAPWDLISPEVGEAGALCGLTDSTGRAAILVSTMSAGPVELRATSESLRDSEPLEIQFDAGSAFYLLLDTIDEALPACKEAAVLLRLADAFGNTVGGSEADSTPVRIEVSATVGEPVIIDHGFASVVSIGEGFVEGTLPSSGWTTVVLTLAEAGAVELQASAETISPGPGQIATATVVFEAGRVDAERSEIETERSEVFAGEAGVQIVVVPRDSCGAQLGAGREVALEAEFGSLSEIVDEGDGTYLAVFSTAEGECPDESAEISARVESVPLDRSVEILSICGELDPSSPAMISGGEEVVEACAGQGFFAHLRIAPRNQSGLAMPPGQHVRIVEDPPYVVMGMRWEEIDPETGDTVYVVQVGSNRCADGMPVEIEVLVGDRPLDARPTIEFTCPEITDEGIGFFASPTVLEADGESVATVRIEAEDRCGNPAFGVELRIEAIGESEPSLSAETVVTADALGDSEDGVAVIEISSEEKGGVGLRATIGERSFDSASSLVTFVDEESGIDVDPPTVSCGCSSTGGETSSMGLLILLGSVLLVLRPPRRGRR